MWNKYSKIFYDEKIDNCGLVIFVDIYRKFLIKFIKLDLVGWINYF